VTTSPIGKAAPGNVDDAIERWFRSLWTQCLTWSDQPHSYWLTRFVLLRFLGLVYFVAFLTLAHQIVPLIGSDGLLPVRLFFQRADAFFGSRFDSFCQLPGIFLFDASDGFLQAIAWLGVVLSLLVLCGFANAILMALLWALYMSFVHVGQDWFSYGWDIQLLETGFIGIFLCPLLDPRPFPKRPPPTPVIWIFRWLGFRIMIGAGLIKMRGDPCWWNLTCLFYHYETQPIPNPLSAYLHFAPHWCHRLSVVWNHFIELAVPWFMFTPRLARHVAGALLISFQVILIISGNLSFLNWLTIVPFLACFDDSLLRRLLPRRLGEWAARAASGAFATPAQKVAVLVYAGIVAVLSIFPVLNLISSQQAMNTSFERLHLVNTYGAFGSIGKERPEIIFQGTSDSVITPQSVWKEYEFKCKPGDPMRRPCVISPYHYRLDWQMWFAAMSDAEHYPWTLHLVWKLLHNDPGALGLIAKNPFPDAPPRYIRAELYRYKFAPLNDPSRAWWKRERLGPWLPALSADDPALRRFLAANGWIPPEQAR
jgi:lipase maturation factor